MAATYKDIQKMTGLSLSTISKYFNGGNVLDENREAIDRAIIKLDFRVNEFARGLKSRRSKTVGMLIPELNSVFHTSIMADVEDYLRQKGYGTIVCDCHLDRSMEKEALEFLLGKMVDGIITIPFDKSGGHLKLAQERNIPVVLIDRLTTDFKANAVIVDNCGASELAVAEFAKNGHDRISIICGPDDIYTMKGRMEGFQKAMQKSGIPIDKAFMNSVNMTVAGGYEVAKRIISIPRRPPALFCAKYEITLGTMIAINELGIKIPDDISIIGFDNLMLARVIKPQLTMVVQPMREIAENAARLMLDCLEKKEVSGNHIIELPTHLMEGASVKKL